MKMYILGYFLFFFFFNDTATTEIYTLSLHDALPIWPAQHPGQPRRRRPADRDRRRAELGRRCRARRYRAHRRRSDRGVEGCRRHEPVRLARCQRGDRHYHETGSLGGISMLSRAMRLLAGTSLVLAVPVAAQRAGTIEVGGFARYVDFDNTLPMGDAMGVGGRVGVYLEPALALELDVARSSHSSITYTPLHLRAV